MRGAEADPNKLRSGREKQELLISTVTQSLADLMLGGQRLLQRLQVKHRDLSVVLHRLYWACELQRTMGPERPPLGVTPPSLSTLLPSASALIALQSCASGRMAQTRDFSIVIFGATGGQFSIIGAAFGSWSTIS